jgi:hypothetical protein
MDGSDIILVPRGISLAAKSPLPMPSAGRTWIQLLVSSCRDIVSNESKNQFHDRCCTRSGARHDGTITFEREPTSSLEPQAKKKCSSTQKCGTCSTNPDSINYASSGLGVWRANELGLCNVLYVCVLTSRAQGARCTRTIPHGGVAHWQR